jgi:hypothetical protein
MNTTPRNYFRKATTAPLVRRKNIPKFNRRLLPRLLPIPLLGLAAAAARGEPVSKETFNSLWSLATLQRMIAIPSFRSSSSEADTTGGTGSFGDGEFGDLDGEIAYSAGIGYDFKDQLGIDQALVRIDWLHSDREAGDLVLGRYDDIVSGTFWARKGNAALVVEAFHASGGDGANTDVFGFFIQPTYDI